MKHFFKKLILLGFLFGCAVLFFILLITISLHSKRDDYFMEFFVKRKMLVDKHHQKTPSIILLGGSNVAFGFNSEILQDSLNMPVINMGLGAGQGLKFMLDNASKYLTEGDILVIAAEYHHFFGNDAYGNTDLASLFYIDPSINEGFNMKQVKALTFGTKNLFRDYLLSLLGLKNKDIAFSQSCKVSDFNSHGDLVRHWTLPPQHYSHVSPGDLKTINMPFLDYYENAVAALRNRGVQVIIIPPSFAETSYKMIEERLIPLFSEFEKRDLGFAIPPQESAYPDSLFFDTHYHLGYEGVLIRTNQLIRAMKPGGE
ncbi:MAG: hypothetical protein LBB73_03355 [Dysgonamonadaceae bacterium]|jgi:hypothetical protein|nr:hypothetical protein [Dysgonamonadaceae bacterium]